MTETPDKKFAAAIKGMLFALGANTVGWLLAFCAGTPTPALRPGWVQGLLSNIPLVVVIIGGLLIILFDD